MSEQDESLTVLSVSFPKIESTAEEYKASQEVKKE